MQPFDLLNAPLEGINLIEASAGTGKTYNIEGLFVRLVLEKRLPVDQILVLTFTNAATEELKERIRSKLAKAGHAFAGASVADPFIEKLVRRYPDSKTAGALIHEALIGFDRAAIFTIHGFCQRILRENAFETRNAFDTELVAGQEVLLQEVADDFWRQMFYTAPLEFVAYSQAGIKGPQYFYRLLERVKTPDVRIIPEMSEPALDSLASFREALRALKRAWPASREAVASSLKDPVLNATLYGSLKTDKNHPELTTRDLKVTGLVDLMDHFADRRSIGFPLFDHFAKFTAAGVQRGTRKGCAPPRHPFFDQCGTVCEQGRLLEAEMERYLLYLKTRLFAVAAGELPRRKKEKNIQHFEDLLIAVRDALRSKDGNLLADEIRRQYRAALVDEFQDTDDIQYDILKRLFAHENSLLFMIGDPKQSIYSFRGADIFSYMKAARHADKRFTLIENWRSRPDLITAVNTLFSSTRNPFVFDEIPFEPVKPALEPAGPRSDPGAAAFTLWYLEAADYSPDGKPVSREDAFRMVSAAVGDEILRLLADGPSAIEPGDIAVLVRTNFQAQRMKAVLSAGNVPSVLFTTANIFDSREALELEMILTAIADPGDLPRLKAALATETMGATAVNLISDELSSDWWEQRIARIRTYHRLWEQQGFMRMFRRLLAAEHIKERLLGLVDGERRVTNTLHLAEILHRQTTQIHAGPTGLLKWLARQRDPSTPRLEEDQLRLESDEKAVKIVTIHKSKGLEYRIVFCPFSWEGSLLREREEFTFHDIENDGRLTLDLGSESSDRHAALAQNEILSENIRLLYVALTRARERCYLAWGQINSTETSALAYLLHGGGGLPADPFSDDYTQMLKKYVGAKSPAELAEDVKVLAARCHDLVRVSPLPAASEPPPVFKPNVASEEDLTYRKFGGKILQGWKIASFSSLLSTEIGDVDLPDRDLSPALPVPDPLIPDAGARSVYSFPGGTRAGSFFHDVLENYDFSAKNPEDLRRLVTAKLQQYGFESDWHDTVCRTIRKVVSLSLRPDFPQLKLANVRPQSRLNEMEFYFPLNSINPDMLTKIFQDHGRSEILAGFPDRLKKLTFAPAAGFMKGYIDLVFEFRGRYYLVDWKSNHLGSTSADYDQNSLAETMRTDYYTLQYHIYTLALQQYLKLRKPDFRYRDHFGGVFYIFLRGVDDALGPMYGVFFDFPAADLMQALGRKLIPGYRPSDVE